MPVKSLEGKLYLYDAQKNPLEARGVFIDYKLYKLTRGNIIKNAEHESLIFEIKTNDHTDRGGSCRGFLYRDNKFLGNLHWNDSASPVKMEGRYEHAENKLVISGSATQDGYINLKFSIHLALY